MHIGNIANNAFFNAKILNQSGFDCDVMCADYYHIMGCPEWEEADFAGAIADQFRPDWTAVDLQGYQRPRWFAQGPQQLCIDYLIARRSGRTKIAALRWEELGVANRTYAAPPGRIESQRAHARAKWRHRLSNLRRYVTMVRERPDALQLVSDKLKSFARIRGPWAEALRVVALPFCLGGAALLRLVAKRHVPDQLVLWRGEFAAG